MPAAYYVVIPDTIEEVPEFVMLSFVLPVNSTGRLKVFNYQLISLYSIGELLDNNANELTRSMAVESCGSDPIILEDGRKIAQYAVAFW
ncbi:MAG: hypothetical protein VX339_13325 [Pseudomonadota bacterium]|jgi:hypothetical protein|nr:hypothetical protein [Pseudomonadota bacterium]